MGEQQSPGSQLLTFLVLRVGAKDAVRVASFILRWGMVARRMGREPTKEEYSVYWRVSQATYYRDLGRLRRAWPGEASPQSKWDWVEANVKLPKGQVVGDKSVLAVLNGPVPS